MNAHLALTCTAFEFKLKNWILFSCIECSVSMDTRGIDGKIQKKRNKSDGAVYTEERGNYWCRSKLFVCLHGKYNISYVNDITAVNAW